MTSKFRRWLPVLLAMQVTTGCGFIKSLFPDKERDYQFRTEIPDLIVPEELKAKTLPERTPEQTAAAAVAATESVAEEQAVAAVPESVVEKKAAVAELKQPGGVAKAEDKPVAPVPAERKETETKDADKNTGEEKPVGQVVPTNPSVSSLQIDQSSNQAWRLVARALSRQRIEIVERNIDKGYFYVKYDPNATKPEDGSIWDEVTFFFGDDPSHEQEYRISLLEIAPQATEVTIQDSEGKTLSNAAATALLKLITDGINQELPEKTLDNVPESVPAP
ncbi:MAG: outer membrane protein assembly factor BamC [Methylococcaceae bacterium]|nr:outer membrane protein assembly factor BamC [Methylococcaceae bacterium]